MEDPSPPPHPVLDNMDIMRTIFDMLNFHQQLRFRLVCRSWRNIGYMTNCWTTHYHSCNDRFIQAHSVTLQRATLRCNQLHLLSCLDLRELQILLDTIQYVDLSDDDTSAEQSLHESLLTQTRLTKLKLEFNMNMPDLNMMRYLWKLTNLRSLTLDGVNLTIHSTFTTLNLPYLQEFEFAGGYLNSGCISNLTGLRSLDLACDTRGEDDQIMEQVSKMTLLQTLTVGNFNTFHFCDYLTNLTNLESFNCHELDDSFSTLNLMSRLTNLKKLDAECSDTVLQQLTKLEELRICAKTNSMNGIMHLKDS